MVEGMERGKTVGTNAVTVDKDFVKTMGMEIAAGSDFTDTDESQIVNTPRQDRVHSFLVNQQFLDFHLMDEEEALGKSVVMNGRSGTIKGVVKDFHFSSLHQEIHSLVMMIEPEQYNMIFIRLNEGNIENALSEVGGVWNNIVPHRPFDFSFMDEEYNAHYQNEQKLSQIFTVFSILAVFIACLGLLGLVSFISYQRSKEISIRKVMGATASGIVVMLSKDFGKWILIAFIIGAPIGYLLMNNWLKDFQYRIEIRWLILLLSLVIIFVIAMVTVSYQALKAALINPADNLRSE